MATKCLFKTLYQIYLFPYRPQKNGKLKGLNGNQESFQRSQYTCSSNICSSLFWYICSSRSGHLFIEIWTSAHEIWTSAHQILDICYSAIKKVKVGLQEKVIRFGRVIFPFLRNRNQERRVQKKCVTPATQLWKVKVCPKKLMQSALVKNSLGIINFSRFKATIL